MSSRRADHDVGAAVCSANAAAVERAEVARTAAWLKPCTLLPPRRLPRRRLARAPPSRSARGVDLVRVEYIGDQKRDIVDSVLELKKRVGDAGFV